MSPKFTTIVSDTTAFKKQSVFAITMITDTVFSVLDGFSIYGSASGITFPAGLTIYGNFQDITLASGSAILYSL